MNPLTYFVRYQQKNTQDMFQGQIPDPLPYNVPYLSDLRYGIYDKLKGDLKNHVLNWWRSPKSEIRFWRPLPNLPHISPLGKAQCTPSISSTNLECIENIKSL